MKKMIIYLAFLMSFCHCEAQLHKGYAVTTNSGANSTDKVVKIFDVHNTSAAPLGNNWNQPDLSPMGANWTLANLGQVFGIAISTNLYAPHIYVSNTQIYQPTTNIPAWTENYPNTYAEGTPLIWDLNPVTGTATVLCVSTQSEAITVNTSNKIYNLGTGIGNICYDAVHNQLFATDMEDGRIYRINASNGKVLSRLDPFTAHATNMTTTPRFEPLGERLWGIGYNNGELYFAVWKVDKGHSSTTAFNEIRSVGVNTVTGDFMATPVPLTLFDYSQSSPTLVVTVPHLGPPYRDNPGVYAWSSPVSDIEFSNDGNQMMLSERTMYDPYFTGGSGDFFLKFAHRSRLLKYDLSGTSWVASASNFFVGNYTTLGHGGGNDDDIYHANSAGGCDFGYGFDDDTTHTPDSLICDDNVWVSGDALKYPGAPSGSDYVYGIAGIPITGNQRDPAHTADPDHVYKSLYQDIFGGSSSGAHKTNPGDVDIYRKNCCSIEATLVAPDSICYGDSVYLHIAGSLWGQFILKDDTGKVLTDSSDIFYIPGRDSIEHIMFNLPAANYTVCFVAYSDNPDSTNEYCTDTICKDITSLLCIHALCDSFIHGNDSIVYIPDSNGTAISYHAGYNSNIKPQYLTWIVNGHVAGQTPADGNFDYTFQTGGETSICMVSVYIFPGEGEYSICCYDTVCISFDNCFIWKATDAIISFLSPLNPTDVTYTYSNSNPSVPLPTNIIWNFGDGQESITDSGATTIVHHYANAGTYHVCAYVVWQLSNHPGPNCCCVDTICFDVNAEPCQFNSFNLDVLDVHDDGTMLNIMPLNSGITINSVTWNVNGMDVATTSTSNYRYDAFYTGSHHICATISYAMLFNGKTFNCTQSFCWDVELTSTGGGSPRLACYPNPTSGDVTVEFYSDVATNNVSLDVYDLMGQPLIHKSIDNVIIGLNKVYLDVYELPKSVYRVKLTIKSKTALTKLVRQ